MSTSAFTSIASSNLPGYSVVTAFAIISALLLAATICWVLWIFTSSKYQDSGARWRLSTERLLVSSQLGRYIVCLVLALFATSLDGALTVNFIRDQGIFAGSVCSSQAVLSQIGFFATAYFVVVISVHTLMTIVFRYKQAPWFGWGVIAVGLGSTLAFTFGPMHHFGFEGFLCGIEKSRSSTQFLFHLLPIWLASVISISSAALIYLAIRGTIIFRGTLRFQMNPNARWTNELIEDEYFDFVGRVAKSILWYPVAYVIMLLPYAMTRMLDLGATQQPLASHIFSYSCVFLLGPVYITLLYNTFRCLGPLPEQLHSTAVDAEKGEASSAKAETTQTKTNRKSFAAVVARVVQKAKVIPKSKPDGQKNVRLAQAIMKPSSSRVRNLTHHRNDSGSSITPLVREDHSSPHEHKPISRQINTPSQFDEEVIATPERAMPKPGGIILPKHTRRLNAESQWEESPPMFSGLMPAPRTARLQIQRKPVSPMVPNEADHTSSPLSRNGSVSGRALPARPPVAFSTSAPRTALPIPTTREAQSSKPVSARRPLPTPNGSANGFRSCVTSDPATKVTIAAPHRVYGDEEASSSSDYSSGEEDVKPRPPKSARNPLARPPKLSPINASSDNDSDIASPASSIYPTVPALVLPAHKRRPGYPSRQAPAVHSRNDSVSRTAHFESGVGSSKAWASLATASLAPPSSKTPSSRRPVPMSSSQRDVRQVPQYRTPISAQAPRLVVPDSAAHGTPTSATHYF